MTSELFDEVNHVLHFDLQLEGDSRYSSFKLHVQLVPGLLEGTTRSQWSFIYEPDNARPPLDIIAIVHPRIVVLSAYLQEFRSGSSASAESAECLVETISSLSSIRSGRESYRDNSNCECQTGREPGRNNFMC